MAQMMIAGNPKRKVASKKTEHPKKKYKRRRNPKMDMLEPIIGIGVGSGGALALNALMNVIPFSDQIKPFKPAISFAAVLGVGFLLSKSPKTKKLAVSLVQGVGTIEAYNFGREMINKVKPGLLSDSSDDDLESLLGEADQLIGRDSGLIGAYEKVSKIPNYSGRNETDEMVKGVEAAMKKKNNGVMDLSAYQMY